MLLLCLCFCVSLMTAYETVSGREKYMLLKISHIYGLHKPETAAFSVAALLTSSEILRFVYLALLFSLLKIFFCGCSLQTIHSKLCLLHSVVELLIVSRWKWTILRIFPRIERVVLETLLGIKWCVVKCISASHCGIKNYFLFTLQWKRIFYQCCSKWMDRERH